MRMKLKHTAYKSAADVTFYRIIKVNKYCDRFFEAGWFDAEHARLFPTQLKPPINLSCFCLLINNVPIRVVNCVNIRSKSPSGSASSKLWFS